jgi:hypothetical protein
MNLDDMIAQRDALLAAPLRTMRISERAIVALMMGTALLAAPALAFDCTPINQPALSVQRPEVADARPNRR